MRVVIDASVIEHFLQKGKEYAKCCFKCLDSFYDNDITILTCQEITQQ